MPAEINFILTLMLDFFLYTSTPMRKSYDEACNGLDVDSINRITLRGKAFWLSVPDKVIELKTNLLKFLTLDAILPVDLSDHRTLLCVVGGADPHHLVQDAADECTRRYPKPSLESQEIVESLMTLYQGSNLIFEFHHDKLPPCSGLIQRKVLDLLCKSVLAANQTERATLIAINAIIRKSSSVKLRWAGMAFLQWIFRMADDGKILASISFDMLKGLVSDKSSEVDGTSKAFAYEAISLLAGRCPALFSNDTTMLKFLFQKLVDEAGQVSFAVLDALKVMVPAFSTLAKSQWKDDILKLLLKYVFHEQKKVRHAAVYYASRMFSFFVPKSRMICLLASCDPKLEIREEALQGMALPQSEDCSERISEQALLFPTYAAEILAILETQLLQPEYAVVHGNVGFINSIPVNVYSNILCFVRGILLRHGFAALTTIEYDEAHLELPFGSEKSFQMFLNTALSTSGPENTAVAGYSEWITRGILAKQADARLISVGASLSLEILSHGPNELTVSHRKHVGWIGNFLASFNPVTRIKFAHILALVSTSDVSLNADMFTKDLAQFIKQSEDTTSQAVSLRHGSLAAIGFIIGRITFRHPNNFFEFVKIEVIQEALSSLISALNESSMIISVACIAIAELTRYICLEENPVISPSLLTMHTRLIEIVKNPSEIKNQEGALLAISHMSHKNKNLGIETMKMYESLPAVFSKQVETYFNCGEAICATMFGFQSTHMLQYLDITGLPTPKFQGIEECAKEAAFDSFINMAKPQSSVISRKAASVWLLCLLKFCSGNALIKRRMIQLHACFSSLLNDSDGICSLT